MPAVRSRLLTVVNKLHVVKAVISFLHNVVFCAVCESAVYCADG